ncbi:8-amino-7-oxononanoate synthase [Fibrella aestuarina BUZ 2]|uniref:8-amino-7-oxononanoate synthase n=1 Tax=Fibrella aestuarina BUZ 2 TaxID=1166018 RepID=I0K2T3_9BACT|nr:8-amino-7-oxononanoate synthase [Fibrella aestuarina]CCG98436.1 8-amino-7-oxononanoate synthase [Fibrella aestuarina BUZ 2]
MNVGTSTTEWLAARLEQELTRRQQSGLLRRLALANTIDFTSNDYLGLARSPALAQHIQQQTIGAERNGATGSRLLAGNSELAESVEHYLAHVYRAESALVFNSGYNANVGLLACLPQRGDTLLTDELIHASLIDGARLSYATRQRFAHNDLADLEQKLQQASGRVFVVVESVYSMDGDEAPLRALADLCDQYGAALLVDEAHASGVYGLNEADGTAPGLVVAYGLQDRVFARIHTFGKALGVHGAVVVGPTLLRDYLINTARSFIYTTALPPHALLAIRCAHEVLAQDTSPIHRLHELIACFQKTAAQLAPSLPWLESTSPIQGLIVPGNEAVRAVAGRAQAAGYDVRPIVSPTVPPGQERLRLCLHSFNTEDEIRGLLDTIRSAA